MDNSRCCQHAGSTQHPIQLQQASFNSAAETAAATSDAAGESAAAAELGHSSPPELSSSWTGGSTGLPAGRRPLVFDKMESLVREMQDPENGVPVRSQKLFLTSIPSAFMGYDMIEWLMERLSIDDSVEAIHIGNLLCQHGYFFPVGECKNLVVKDDSSLYRFQTPYYWPSQNHNPENSEYVVYLYKRSLRNKQKHGLEEYETEALSKLKRQLAHKWDFIVMQAEEQVRLAKDRKKGDKIVTDSQERAYWRAYRPPPGFLNCLELPPYPNVQQGGVNVSANNSATLPAPFLQDSSGRQWKSVDEIKAEVEYLRSQLVRARIKVSVAAETLQQHSATYAEFDPFLPSGQPQPSNPWISDDPTYWVLNAPVVEVPTEKRAKRWAISIEDLVTDQTGLQELTNYLRKEYSHENIRFWLATNQLRSGPASCILQRVQEIYQEFLAPGAPCEINIDGRTMERVQQEMRRPSRFTFDRAAEHVYNLLLKKDCYPRFVRSEHYRQLLLNALQPSQKKRFFNFGTTGKKKSISAASSGAVVPAGCIVQPQLNQSQQSGASFKRRGSTGGLGGDRSPSGSPPDNQLHPPSGSSILASSSATTAAASAGINTAAINPLQGSSGQSSVPGSGGDECDTPYRGDMPGSLRPSAAPPPSALAHHSSATAASTNYAPPVPPPSPSSVHTSVPSPTPPPPQNPLHSGSSCSESSPPIHQADDVCPWESVSPPVSIGTGSTGNRTTGRFLSVDLPSGQDPSFQHSPKRSSLCVDNTGRPLVEGGRQKSPATAAVATDSDICPWESVLPPASSSPRSKTPVMPPAKSPERKRSTCTELVESVDLVCPWESQEPPAVDVAAQRIGSIKLTSQELPAAPVVSHQKSVSDIVTSTVILLNKNPSPGPSRSVKEMSGSAAAAGTDQPPLSPSPAASHSSQPGPDSKISDVCPWEDDTLTPTWL